MFSPTIEQGQLPNGARYFLADVPNAGFLSTNISFGVGSSDERPKERGVAHYLEHLILAHGPMYYGEQFILYYKNKLQLQANAATGLEDTIYNFQGLKSRCLSYSDILEKILTPQSFKHDLVERERAVIINEINDRSSDVKSSANLHHRNSVVGDHPVGLSVLGTKDIIKELSGDDIHRFYLDNYSADKAVLTVSGDITKTGLLERFERITNDLPAGKPHNRPGLKPITSYGEKHVGNVESVIVNFSFVEKEDVFENIFTRNVMYSLLSGYLHNKARNRGTSYGIAYNIYGYQDYSLRKFSFVCDPDDAQRNMQQVLKDIKDFSGTNLESLVEDRRNAHEHSVAVRKENYLYRAESMLNQYLNYGYLLDQDYADGVSLGLTSEKILESHNSLMRQTPSVTFYGNTDAAKLPDNNKWIVDQMQL